MSRSCGSSMTACRAPRPIYMAGYDGLLVCLDEMVSLAQLTNAQARIANYEQILRILNDSLQGSAAYLHGRLRRATGLPRRDGQPCSADQRPGSHREL